MQAWKQNDNVPFNFYDAHSLNTARDTSLEESIKRQLRERLQNTKIFTVLLGERTRFLRKFVRWELEQAIKLKLPIVVVNLNGLRKQDLALCPPIIRDELAIHISFNARILQYALERWPETHRELRSHGKSGAYYYPQSLYTKLGIK